MIGWSLTNKCCLCDEQPRHRLKDKKPGAVWIYFCDTHFLEVYGELKKRFK